MRVLLLFLASIPFLPPDPSLNGVKIVTRQVTGGTSDTKTEYLTANRLRSEWQTHIADRTGPPLGAAPGPHRAPLPQRGGPALVFLLALKPRKNTLLTPNPRERAKGKKPHPPAYPNGTLKIWIENTDPGKRQKMFGHMARHII